MRVALLAVVAVGASASSAPRRDDLWSLRGRRAVVTGGSKGLGRAIVEELLSQGCEVITCARDVGPLAALLAAEPQLTAVVADVSTPDGRRALLAAIKQRFADEDATTGAESGGGASGGGPAARLDLLVNNVGTNLRKASVDYSDEDYSWLHETNQASAFHMSRMCFGALARARGSVVCVSSISGGTVDSTGAPYHMTKAAMEHMTRSAGTAVPAGVWGSGEEPNPKPGPRVLFSCCWMPERTLA
jgi:Tropinone reductase 1